MKRTKKHAQRYCPAYPNAASPEYYKAKLLDVLTAIASGMGFIALFFYFLCLC